MKFKLIISIDAGGIRGIIPLVILRAIQSGLKRDLRNLVTDWYGTSTGAVISAGLLVQDQPDFGIAIQNVLDIYEFRSGSSINPLGASNPARAFNKLMDENFSTYTLNQFPSIHAVTCKLPSFDVRIFHRENISLSEALKASCAVPGIFDPVLIENDIYIDGFLKAKNPASVLLQNIPDTNTVVLSLGTGILREKDVIEEQVRKTHLDMEAASKKFNFHYFRFNPELIEAADSMQDTRLRNIFALKKDTETYLARKDEKLKGLINLLEQF